MVAPKIVIESINNNTHNTHNTHILYLSPLTPMILIFVELILIRYTRISDILLFYVSQYNGAVVGRVECREQSRAESRAEQSTTRRVLVY